MQLLCGASVLAMLCAAPRAQAQSFCRYEITAVIQGPSCGILGPALVQLNSINDLGQVCGYFRDCQTLEKQPFAWSEETGFVILPLPDGAVRGEAKDMNNTLGSDGLGQIACVLGGAAFGGDKAYVYNDGVWTQIPPDDPSDYSETRAINDAGQVTGYREAVVNGETQTIAFRWERGEIADIYPAIGGAVGEGMNEQGDIAGWTYFLSARAFWWDGATIIDLGTILGGPQARARDINRDQAIVGNAHVADRSGSIHAHGFVLDGDDVVDLGIPAGYTGAAAIDINDAGQVLIAVSDQTGLGGTYLWQQGEMTKVVDLVESKPGVNYGGLASAINNHGQIAGVAAVSTTNAGVILTPVDHPLGDINLDCAVDQYDLIALLNDWGPCPALGSCLCDVVDTQTLQPPGDGVVNGADLAIVLDEWMRTASAPPANRRR